MQYYFVKNCLSADFYTMLSTFLQWLWINSWKNQQLLWITLWISGKTSQKTSQILLKNKKSSVILQNFFVSLNFSLFYNCSIKFLFLFKVILCFWAKKTNVCIIYVVLCGLWLYSHIKILSHQPCGRKTMFLVKLKINLIKWPTITRRIPLLW